MSKIVQNYPSQLFCLYAYFSLQFLQFFFPGREGARIFCLRSWVSATGGRDPWPPWIFIHGTDMVGRGLIVVFFVVFFCYFFSLFSVAFPHWKRLNSAIFRSFFAVFSGFFSLPLPLWNFFLMTPLPPVQVIL